MYTISLRDSYRAITLYFAPKRIVVVLLSLVLVLFAYVLHHIYAYITSPPLLYISDTHADTLLQDLQAQGVDLNILDYRLTKRYRGILSGWVRFDPDKQYSREDFFVALNSKLREKTRRIIMYSGMTLENFAETTARQTQLAPQKIIEQYHRHSPYKEGGIIAGYYRIPYRTTPEAILYYMTSTSDKQFKAWAAHYLEKFSVQTWERILTVASIIQKETQSPKEMPLISSVIYNRLNRGMKLQLDATLNYGRYSHQAITPKRIREDKSAYNTYLHKGLPPHPIASATKEAILAALNPADTDYLYFMLAENGTHNFASDYAQHLAHIRWYKAEKKKNGYTNH